MASGFPTALHALEAIRDCLVASGELGDAQVSYGSAGSGEGIDCCPKPLLRIERMSWNAEGAAVSLHSLTRPCRGLPMRVQVLWRECFVANDGTVAGRGPAVHTAQGSNLILHSEAVLAALACCSPLNVAVRFVSIDDTFEESCVGWNMVLETDVAFCQPCT